MRRGRSGGMNALAFCAVDPRVNSPWAPDQPGGPAALRIDVRRLTAMQGAHASAGPAGDAGVGQGRGCEVGAIGPGLCVLVGVTHTDTEATCDALASKVWHLRILADDDGVMNRSVGETTGEVLVVSQFTLYGDTRRAGGRRGSPQPGPRRPSRWSTRSWTSSVASVLRSPPAASVPTWPSSSSTTARSRSSWRWRDAAARPSSRIGACRLALAARSVGVDDAARRSRAQPAASRRTSRATRSAGPRYVPDRAAGAQGTPRRTPTARSLTAVRCSTWPLGETKALKPVGATCTSQRPVSMARRRDERDLLGLHERAGVRRAVGRVEQQLAAMVHAVAGPMAEEDLPRDHDGQLPAAVSSTAGPRSETASRSGSVSAATARGASGTGPTRRTAPGGPSRTGRPSWPSGV